MSIVWVASKCRCPLAHYLFIYKFKNFSNYTPQSVYLKLISGTCGLRVTLRLKLFSTMQSQQEWHSCVTARALSDSSTTAVKFRKTRTHISFAFSPHLRNEVPPKSRSSSFLQKTYPWLCYRWLSMSAFYMYSLGQKFGTIFECIKDFFLIQISNNCRNQKITFDVG